MLDRYIVDNDIILLPNRAMFIRSLNALVIADLHLGIEYALALKGIFLPAYQFREIREIIEKYIRDLSPEKLIVVGDFKHEFAQKTLQEHKETLKLLEIIRGTNIHFILVRGNHDNFIRGILSKYNVDFKDPYHVDGNYLFIHGHKEIPPEILSQKRRIKYVIMAHEHPAILFRDEVGGKAKIPVFLVGHYPELEAKLIVLPALSPIATGVEVNISFASDFLSPILQKMDIDLFKPIASLDKGLLDLPLISQLRIF